MDIGIHTDVYGKVRLGVMELGACENRSPSPELEEEIRKREEELRKIWQGKSPGEIPELKPARLLYRSAGLDPTRNRPSSEALVRRVLKGGSLPRINKAVDACNLCAISYFLPIGLYDMEKIIPPVMARLGKEGESYEGLGKPRVNLSGRFCLEDRNGPFGNPSSDSKRTRVSEETKRLLWVIFAPFDYPTENLASHLEFSRKLVERIGLCVETAETYIVPADRGKEIERGIRNVVHAISNTLSAIYAHAEPALETESLRKDALESILRSCEALEKNLKDLKRLLGGT